jgi:hypothetical protein
VVLISMFLSWVKFDDLLNGHFGILHMIEKINK